MPESASGRHARGPPLTSALRNLSIWILDNPARQCRRLPPQRPGHHPGTGHTRNHSAMTETNVMSLRPGFGGLAPIHLLGYIRAMLLESVGYSTKGKRDIMNSLYSWLPPRVRWGIQCGQRARKWGKFVHPARALALKHGSSCGRGAVSLLRVQ